jgi:hypothetical protein
MMMVEELLCHAGSIFLRSSTVLAWKKDYHENDVAQASSNVADKMPNVTNFSRKAKESHKRSHDEHEINPETD